jgi:glutamyl-tRNA reductase
MLPLFCLSFDHRHCDSSSRAKEAARWASAAPDGANFIEHLALFTCNRFEFFAVPGREGEKLLRSSLSDGRLLEGEDVAIHLLRLLLGLESLALGEEQIVGQIRRAYSEGSSGCGPLLHYLFQQSLSLASALRSRYHPGKAPSTASLMAKVLEEEHGPGPHQVIVVGCGMIGLETARILKRRNHTVTVTNRTETKAREAASTLGLSYLPWSQWRQRAATADALFLCTASPSPLEGLPPKGFGGTFFDLGASPQIARRSDMDLVTLDSIACERDRLLGAYRRSLLRLEQESWEVGRRLWQQMESRWSDTYRRLAMGRARQIALNRAQKTALSMGWDKTVLEQMAWSIVKGVLHPLLEENGAHTQRAWKMLAREEES